MLDSLANHQAYVRNFVALDFGITATLPMPCGLIDVMPVPSPEDAQAWEAIREKDVMIAGGPKAEGYLQLARAMGCRRAFIMKVPLLEEPGALAQHRAEARRLAGDADLTILRPPSTGPAAIPLDALGSLGVALAAAADHRAAHRDFVSALVWPALSGLTGCDIHAAPSPGFVTPCIVYAGIIAEPGSNKSGAGGVLNIPKRHVEERLEARWDAECGAAEVDGTKPKDLPPRPMVRVANATAEAMLVCLSKQDRGLECQVDELATVLPQLGADRYSSSAPLAGLWLRGWDGGRYDYVRRSAGDEPLLVRNCATPVSFCAQPAVAGELFQANAKRRDGLCDRFLLAFPDPFEVEPRTNPMPLEQADKALADGFLAIHDAARRMAKDGPVIVPFDADAQQEFDRWRRGLIATAKMMTPDRYAARMKAPAQFARIAGLAAFVRHVIDKDPLVVDGALARQIVATMRAFLTHRFKVEAFVNEPLRERAARELARAIVARRVTSFETAAARRTWGLSICRTEADMREALVELSSLGIIQERIGRGHRDPLPHTVTVPRQVLEAADAWM